MIRTGILALLLGLAWRLPAGAVTPAEMLSDPALEARARDLSQGLRCLVCQNQSIDDSSADLAHDLRVLVRDRLKAGDSDTEVMSYVVSRYGQFVLLKPPIAPATYVLWFAPAVILALGLAGARIYIARRRNHPVVLAPLSGEEKAELARLAGEEGQR
ncbi:MAG: cytochrome c-type biogenesis protein CcmH [Proteobacteria bacterium]|nr:cytochrome c-type biogenesis protein CcmH [Pseudomonadota bacterium]